MGGFKRPRRKKAASINHTVSLLSAVIFESAVVCADSVRQCFEDFEEDSGIDGWKFWEIALEFQFFFLHVTDRLACSILGHKKKSVFMGSFLEANIEATVETVFERFDHSKRKTLLNSLVDEFNTKNFRYAECKKLFPEEAASPKGTLFWHFGEAMAETIGRPCQSDYVSLCSNLAEESLEAIRLDHLLKRIP